MVRNRGQKLWSEIVVRNQCQKLGSEIGVRNRDQKSRSEIRSQGFTVPNIPICCKYINLYSCTVIQLYSGDWLAECTAVLCTVYIAVLLCTWPDSCAATLSFSHSSVFPLYPSCLWVHYQTVTGQTVLVFASIYMYLLYICRNLTYCYSSLHLHTSILYVLTGS